MLLVVSNISLAPNPAIDMVTLTLETTSNTELQVRFLSSTGVQSDQFVPVVQGVNTLRFSTKSFPAGVYTIALRQGNDLQTVRMVKVSE